MDTLIPRAGRVIAAAALLAGLAVAQAGAQDATVPAARPPAPAEPAPPSIPAAPAVATPPGVTPPDAVLAPDTAGPDLDAPRSAAPRAAAPTGPARPVRSPVAILRVLDKVSAQTMAFAAPIGQRVRYKSLIFEVKACETRDPLEPQPHTSAYLIITSDHGAASGGVLGRRQVYRGWMFAESPSVSPFRNPVYDAWLVSCAAEAPV